MMCVCEISIFPYGWFHHMYLNDIVWRQCENQEKPNEKKILRKPKIGRNALRCNCVRMFNCFGSGAVSSSEFRGGCMLVLLACGLAQSVSECGNEYVYVLYLDFRQTTHALVCMHISRSETKTILRVWNRCSETITKAGKCVLNCQIRTGSMWRSMDSRMRVFAYEIYFDSLRCAHTHTHLMVPRFSQIHIQQMNWHGVRMNTVEPQIFSHFASLQIFSFEMCKISSSSLSADEDDNDLDEGRRLRGYVAGGNDHKVLYNRTDEEIIGLLCWPSYRNHVTMGHHRWRTTRTNSLIIDVHFGSDIVCVCVSVCGWKCFRKLFLSNRE